MVPFPPSIAFSVSITQKFPEKRQEGRYIGRGQEEGRGIRKYTLQPQCKQRQKDQVIVISIYTPLMNCMCKQ